MISDLSGQTRGALTVLRRAGSTSGEPSRRVPLWECLCKCGRTWVIRANHLRSGDSKSCGCLYAFARARLITPVNGTHRTLLRLRQLRIAAGIKLQDLGAMVGVTGSWLGKLENGSRTVNPKLLDRWSKALGVSQFGV